jgi:hypothetical protein
MYPSIDYFIFYSYISLSFNLIIVYKYSYLGMHQINKMLY